MQFKQKATIFDSYQTYQTKFVVGWLYTVVNSKNIFRLKLFHNDDDDDCLMTPSNYIKIYDVSAADYFEIKSQVNL